MQPDAAQAREQAKLGIRADVHRLAHIEIRHVVIEVHGCLRRFEVEDADLVGLLGSGRACLAERTKSIALLDH